MSRLALGVLAGCIAGGQVAGQVSPFTITHRGAEFGFASEASIGALGGNANRTGTGGGSTSFFRYADGTPNALPHTWWWYHLANGPREYAFSSRTSVIFSSDRREMTLTYIEPEGIRADLTYDVVGFEDRAVVRQAMLVTNVGTSLVQFSLFNYANIDVNGTASDDFAYSTGHGFTTFTDSDPGFVVADAVSAFRREYGFSTDLLSRMADDQLTDLTHSTSPIGPGDLEGVWEWAGISLNPGQSFVARSQFLTGVPTPGAGALLGVAGLAGLRRRRA